LPCFPKAPHVGFGYPFCGSGSWLPSPWWPFSASNAPGLHPPELFSLSVIRNRFPNPSFALALSWKTQRAFHRCSSDLHPPKEPRPSLPPKGLVRVGAFLLSWVFKLLRLSLKTAQKKVISPFFFPFHSSNPKAFQLPDLASLRVFSTALHGVSPCGAPACTAFYVGVTHHLFNRTIRCGLFFHLERSKALTSLRFLLLAANALFPNGRW